MRAMLLALAIVAVMPASLLAADRTAGPSKPSVPVESGPYSPLQSRQAQAVGAARECWRTCELSCTGDLQACLAGFPATACLPAANACDRACQRQCRFTGDPVVDFFE
jgi:hypothetical protein